MAPLSKAESTRQGLAISGMVMNPGWLPPSVCLVLYGVNERGEQRGSVPMANALTALRLLLVAPFAFYMARGDARSAWIVLAIWLVALVTDLTDGPVARRRGTVTPLSGTFDHTTDFLFVTSGLFAGASRGAFPRVLPLLIVAAFAQYMIDSYWIHRQRKLRGSKLGRYNGILYFAPTCMDGLMRVKSTFLQPLITALVWLLVLSTLVSMGQRLMMSVRLSKDLPGGAPEK